MNPLMQGMGAGQAGGMNPQMIQQAKQMVSMLKMSMNPKQAEAQLKQICGNFYPQEFFIQQCRAHGLDPDKTMEQIHQIIA